MEDRLYQTLKNFVFECWNKFINECRRSDMTDADWCRENGIASSTLIIHIRLKFSFHSVFISSSFFSVNSHMYAGRSSNPPVSVMTLAAQMLQ